MQQQSRFVTLALSSVFTFSAGLAHADTVAYWQFEGGSGQSVANSGGSSTMTLQLGSTDGVDANDPVWVEGGVNGEDADTYLTASTGWTDADQESLALANTSFTVETIVTPDSLPNPGGSFGDRAMGFLQYRDNNGGASKFLMRMAAGSSADQSYVWFFTGSSGDVYFNTNAANDGDSILITAGKSYYFAATYDQAASSLEFQIRDLATGETARMSQPWSDNAALDGSPYDTLLLVGSEVNTARSFDGTISEVRISNHLVAEQDRLYNINVEPLVGDLDEDGFVGLDDLDIVLENWNQSVPPADAAADPSGDGFVGLDDLDIVLGNWNAGTPSSAAVPEPVTFVLLALGGTAVLAKRH